jgi:hypothetical protein
MSAFAPWRSVLLARIVTVAVLAFGVPLFLRMPPWCDLTLYDIAAKNINSGGIHYRDVFDTNLPGFVWLLAGWRSVAGGSIEAVRLLDLSIVAAIVFLMDRLAKRAGATPAARAWAIAGAAAFYPFSTEFVHCQRDVWMLLPALAAVLIRIHRLTNRGDSRLALAEGVLWGLAVWIKPHVIVPAAVLWGTTAPWLTTSRLRDLAGNLLGGLIVGLLGILYLFLSGTWEHFVEVFTVWNTRYAETMIDEFGQRAVREFGYFPPWSLLHLLGVPVAVLTLFESVLPRWPNALWHRTQSDSCRLARIAFAALYLGWLGQALLIQREYHYVHVPETLLVLGLLATQRWAAGALVIAGLCITSLIVRVGGQVPANTTGLGPDRGPCWAILHPAFDPDRQALWPECWKPGIDRRRDDKLALIHGFHAANDWEQLAEVAEWLKTQNVRDGDVIAWHDAPHAVYLLLEIKPGFRFQHVSHMEALSRDHYRRIHDELRQAMPHVRFVVSDLMRCGAVDAGRVGPMGTAGPDGYPEAMRADVKKEFPYFLPVAFRSGGGTGRYIVHAAPQ